MDVTAAAVACAIATFASGAGSALAPEAGRLNTNSPLAAQYSAWAYGYWVESRQPTYGFYLSNQWKTGYPYAAYAGDPCSRYSQPGGATLTGIIMVNGSWSRCSEY